MQLWPAAQASADRRPMVPALNKKKTLRQRQAGSFFSLPENAKQKPCLTRHLFCVFAFPAGAGLRPAPVVLGQPVRAARLRRSPAPSLLGSAGLRAPRRRLSNVAGGRGGEDTQKMGFLPPPNPFPPQFPRSFFEHPKKP